MEHRVMDALATAMPTIAPTAEPVVNSMTTGERAVLGAETTVTGMVIVFAVLIILSLIVMCVSRMLKSSKNDVTSKTVETSATSVNVESVATASEAVVPQLTVKRTGHLVTDGVGSEEEIAVIMAAVVAHSGASLDSLEFKSITLIDE